MKLIYFFCGGCRLCAAPYEAEKILNICLHYRFVYRNMKRSKDFFTLECSMYTANMLCSVCEKYGIAIKVIEKYGLPDVFIRYRKRIGILAGFIISAVLIIWSEQFVWDIRVKGCENIDEIIVKKELSDQNFRLGTYIPGIDIDMIENRVLIYSQDIAWISINMKGSVAYVEIREKTAEPEKKSDRPANLIALWDGMIETIEATEGNIMVRVGQHVRKGELLVSGVYDSNVWGYRYTRAAGNVYARTVREIHVEIPLYYEERRYSGEEYSEITLFFFSKPIKLYRNTGFLVGTYDTICKEENICLFDGTRIPLTVITTINRWYTCETLKRDTNTAMELAYDKLDVELAKFLSDGAVLLGKNITWTITDDTYVLDCTATLIENIAGIAEFEVSEK